jgi:Carboxypeptidase regulatory-like domain
MRQFIRALLAVCILAIATSVQAQTLGTIAGTAKDATGAVLPGVTVEVASPALIEKTRTAVTDGSGAYAIVSLPVGTYTVNFSLQGFTNFKREGIELLANFTATVNAEMKVGTVAETITVTGESPLVDVQGVVTTRAVTPELIKAIPNGGTMYQLAAMMPGVTISGPQDVGGSLGSPVQAQLLAHGGTGGDEIQLVDGMRVGNMMGGSRTQQTLSPLLYDQVDVQLSGQGGDAASTGVTTNSIPRSGGNRFSGTVLGNGSGPGLQSNNLTQRLKDLQLLASPTSLKTLYDFNGSIGGPIAKDRAWFYFTARKQSNQTYVAGLFGNANPYPIVPNLTYVATSDRGFDDQFLWDTTYRVTVAPTQKLRLSGFADVQHKNWNHWLISAAASPESVGRVDWPGRIYQGTGSYVATNKLLIEAGFNYQDSRDTIYPRDNPDGIIPSPNGTNGPPNAVRVVEQGATVNGQVIAPITFGPFGATTIDNPMAMKDSRASMSYVTGSHSFKLGFDMQQGYRERVGSNFSNDIQYRTQGYRLNQVTIFAPVGHYRTNLDYEAGIFVQDRWTFSRLSLNGAVRLDVQKESYDPYTLNPTFYTPNRAVQTFPGADIVSWKEINPRFGAAYDLFGNGRTALKFAAVRGNAQESIATADSLNPGVSISSSAVINITDNNLNNFPDCNLFSPTANNECLGYSPQFGTALPLAQYDPAVLSGWGVRPWNWEFSAGVQQELTPRVSVGVTYFRRINGGFLVTDNIANTVADFKSFQVTAPTDSRLSNSGQLVTVYDVNPTLTSGLTGLTTVNRTTFASNFGNVYQHWNGLDFTGMSRLGRGATMQGGLTVGKGMTDNCEVARQLPEILVVAGSNIPLEYCHAESGWFPQFKVLGAYEFPWQNIRVSANFQSLPGPARQAGVIYASGAAIGLNRGFTGGGNKTVNMFPVTGFINSNSAALFGGGAETGDRLNQLDLRFSRIVKMGKRGNVDLNFDVYNTFNSDAVTTETTTYASPTAAGAWLKPTVVLQGRIIKFGARWDF